MTIGTAIINELYRSYELKSLYKEETIEYFKRAERYNSLLASYEKTIGPRQIISHYLYDKKGIRNSKFNTTLLDVFNKHRREHFQHRMETDYMYSFVNLR